MRRSPRMGMHILVRTATIATGALLSGFLGVLVYKMATGAIPLAGLEHDGGGQREQGVPAVLRCASGDPNVQRHGRER